MTLNRLREQAESYLVKLCVDIDNRCVGSTGNRAATDFFAGIVSSFGFETEAPAFDCIDWHQEGVALTAEGVSFTAFASPYSLSCQVRAPLVVVPTVEALETAALSNKIVLLCGEMTKEQLMPKSFPFYNPDHHQRIIRLLETTQPRAIITATARDPDMVGGAIYPFPLIEDGDFDIPSAYMTDEEGYRLAEYAGKEVFLAIQARRIPATGCNVIARKGTNPQRRVVVFAHIDAKMGTPGACDNAAGVIVLLLLAELLANYPGQLGLELVALNGEDYFSSPGEQQYLALNTGRFEEIGLGINVDGVCSTTNLALVKSLGADAVIDYTKEDLISRGEHYDFILDAVGKNKRSKLKSQCKQVLTKHGKYISVDDGTPKSLAKYLVHLNELIEAGHFKAVIDRCYPLEQIVEAHRYVDKGHKKGNVVITMTHNN